MKTIIVALIFTMFLYAQDNNKKQLKYTPKVEYSSEYIKAVVFYNTQSYKKSFELFHKLFLENLQNINVNYYLALNSISLGDYGFAYGCLERILIQNPSSYKARFLMAKLNYLIKNYNDAFIIVNELKQENITPEQLDELNKLLYDINKHRGTVSLESMFLLGLESSDNVNNGVSKKYLLPDFFNDVPQGDDSKSDNSLIYMLSLNIKKQSLDNHNLTFENEFLYFDKIFSNEKKENFEFYSYSPALSYLLNDSYLKLALLFSRYKPGHKTNVDYFDSVGLKSDFYKKNYGLNFKAQRFFYRDSASMDKNYTRYLAQYRLFKLAGFDMSFAIKKDIAFKSSRSDLNKSSFSSLFEYDFNFKNNFTIKPSLNMVYTKYKDESIAFNSKREDKQFEYRVDLKRVYKKNNIYTLGLSYLDNNSNHAQYDYDSQNVGLYYIRLINL